MSEWHAGMAPPYESTREGNYWSGLREIITPRSHQSGPQGGSDRSLLSGPAMA